MREGAGRKSVHTGSGPGAAPSAAPGPEGERCRPAGLSGSDFEPQPGIGNGTEPRWTTTRPPTTTSLTRLTPK